MRQAFNDYLYNLRIKKGFTSVKKFAKEIGVSSFRYGSYERGYLHPNAKDKAKMFKEESILEKWRDYFDKIVSE